MFCNRDDLGSAAEVEALFVDRLLARLRYPDSSVKRGRSLEKLRIPRGSQTEPFIPDYVLQDRRGSYAVILDSKHPDENPESFRYQVAGYALLINERYSDENPVRYVATTNGLRFTVWPWDDNEPLISLSFDDFRNDHPKYTQLRSLLAYGSLDVERVTGPVFRFQRPDLNELTAVFKECHYIIWKKEKLGPTDAFYEFAKLVFVKLREDRRITEKINDGDIPTLQDFNFSVPWIEQQVDREILNNPIQILFKGIREEIQQQIRQGDKKRIFSDNEALDMRTETVSQVVEKLQHFNLHGIDEDLNGRMFQSFLNATVRGKELGQFFTPRSVVKYMTGAAGLDVRGDTLPTVLDGCCGSGGFLIEAMAVLVHSIECRNDLTAHERDRLKEMLFRKHLFGIDASEKIARIARLNMYLHGDGGSTIYVADALDHEVKPPKGHRQELEDETSELREHLVKDGLRFDVVLTNPPFSMSYKRQNADERAILDRYEIATTGAGKPSSSEKSNVLFLERYLNLLKPGEELLTVIDNTLLNGVASQRHRDFLLEHFIIRQIVSLPFNTFFRAQANVHTSVLHLKKREVGEEQGHVFMAILNNVGHDDHQIDTPNRDNIPTLQDAYAQWSERGYEPKIFAPNKAPTENLGCPLQIFAVPPEQLDSRRLDAFYYAPELVRTREAMLHREAAGALTLLPGRDFEVVPRIPDSKVGKFKGKIYRYFEIGDVTPSGAIVSYRERLFEELPTRARQQVRQGDVLFARNNSSRGTAVIVPSEFDGQFVTTGFLAVRPRSEEEGLLLWAAMTSEQWRKQVYYLAITAVQPEVRNHIFEENMLVPMPTVSGAGRLWLIEQSEYRACKVKCGGHCRRSMNSQSILTRALQMPRPFAQIGWPSMWDDWL